MDMLKAVGGAVVEYLKDWRNLVAHGAVGVGLVVVTVFLPVSPMARICILIAVVAFNVLRTRSAGRKRDTTGEAGATV